MGWVSLDFRVVRTRKAHECFGCRRTFPVGTMMRVSAGMWRGDPPSRERWCLVCDRWLDEYIDAGDELPIENWMGIYPEEYAAIEAGLAEYVAAARVPTHRQFRAKGKGGEA